MYQEITTLVIFIFIAALIYLFVNSPQSTSKNFRGEWTPEDVGKYYDEWLKEYEIAYGDTIQSVRTSNLQDLHEYIMQKANLENGQKILDAGCGVGAPAVFFAQHLDITIKGLTVSAKQAEKAQERIQNENLESKVEIICGDYHQLAKIYPQESFDTILFLESLGHAQRVEEVLQNAYQVLKPKGKVFIKDFVGKKTWSPGKQKRIERALNNVNKHYRYNCLDYNNLLSALNKVGFQQISIEPITLASDPTAWKTLEERNGIDLYEGKEIGFADWYEFTFQKPS